MISGWKLRQLWLCGGFFRLGFFVTRQGVSHCGLLSGSTRSLKAGGSSRKGNKFEEEKTRNVGELNHDRT